MSDEDILGAKPFGDDDPVPLAPGVPPDPEPAPPAAAMASSAASDAASHAPSSADANAPCRPTFGFMARHPAHWIAMGFGSGLAPRAPGTVGTLWGWAAFALLNLWLTPFAWGVLIAAGLVIGAWASTVTARNLRVCDPGAVVWDEIVAIWLILWIVMPAGFWWQLAAFVVFRYFDAAKPGPVRWADGLFKIEPGQPVGFRQGFGILFDDLVAAGCTLVVLAIARAVLG